MALIFEMTARSNSGQDVANFAKPATLTMTVPPETLAQAAGGGVITLYFYSASTNSWRAVLTEVSRDGTLTAQIPHFSTWALIVTKELLTGGIPRTGYGLVVFGGGTLDTLLSVVRCPRASVVLWAATKGEFVAYVPGTTVTAVNTTFLSLFPRGVVPANTPFLGRCLPDVRSD